RSTDSSAWVSRSINNVPRLARCRSAATDSLRGLKRLLPLPWAKITTARASSGMVSVPLMEPLATGMEISRGCSPAVILSSHGAINVMRSDDAAMVCACLKQQLAAVFIAGLGKILVPLPDGQEMRDLHVVLQEASHCVRICFGQLTRVPGRSTFQRLQRAGVVTMNDRIELLRQPGIKVMTEALRFRQVDHSNRALQPTRQQIMPSRINPQIQQEIADAGLMKEFFVTGVKCRTHFLPLCFAAPLRCRSHRPGISCKSDRNGFLWMALAGKLSEIEFAPLTHFGGARVAQM